MNNCTNIGHPVPFGGRCSCGRVICGSLVWKLHAEQGMPIELSIPLLWDIGNTTPTWPELIAAGVKDGANKQRLLERIVGVIQDTYPLEHRAEILGRLTGPI